MRWRCINRYHLMVLRSLLTRMEPIVKAVSRSDDVAGSAHGQRVSQWRVTRDLYVTKNGYGGEPEIQCGRYDCRADSP
jgi:hypothetical protein